MSKKFGEFLKQARERLGKKQNEMATLVGSYLGKTEEKAPKSLIAHYEGGRIILPDPKVLRALAQAYQVNSRDLAARIAMDVFNKYRNIDELESSNPNEDALPEWEAALSVPSTVGRVKGLERHLRRARAAFIKDAEILDVEGLGEWQKNFEGLIEFWVITPLFVDTQAPSIRDAVVHNLRRGVKYFYFVRESDQDKEGKFQLLQHDLKRAAPDLSLDHIKSLTKSVPIAEEHMKWINTDVVAANPMTDEPVAFSSVRQQGVPMYGVKMGDLDVRNLLSRLAPYAADHTHGETGTTIIQVSDESYAN